ncbi:hypothetical protein [Stenoxybacter acetivorans]|uniref:hypothetical protein n=1 Tax=Stenoxybacter acetivorans TaxID=422441 RepID=UPI00056A384E|nr:hypothetical protein [Stenoxybacter acetivorans]
MKTMFATLAVSAILGMSSTAFAAVTEKPADADNFYKSDKVTIQKVTFPNQYKMNIAGNLFMPENMDQSKKYR